MLIVVQQPLFIGVTVAIESVVLEQPFVVIDVACDVLVQQLSIGVLRVCRAVVSPFPTNNPAVIAEIIAAIGRVIAITGPNKA